VLTHLHIRNLAVVDEVETELADGMTVLTGETGAGKSILVDALSLTLGSRADSDFVRPGATRAEISASFLVDNNSKVDSWLSRNDLDDSNECILRRIVTAEGRSRGYINGNSVPMATLRELGELLVDICGQQAHQSLARPDNQRLLLDQHGNHAKLLTDIAKSYNDWRAAQSAYAELDAARADQNARLELLSFQVQELETLAPQPGELAELDQTHRRAANASKLVSGAAEALASLYENEQGNAHDLVGRANVILAELGELDPALKPLAGMLTEASIQISEAADTLRDYINQDDNDEQQLGALENRLAAFHDIARKHRVDANELAELAERLRDDLHAIENADDTLEKLRIEADDHETTLLKLCSKLTRSRTKAAKSLAAAVSANMQELGMPEGKFIVNLAPLKTPSATGSERVEFAVAINPGLPAGPLNKVASGGELSRVSLAIQVASSSKSNTPTLIFDEVDAGVGGRTADIVGDKLRSLAQNNQVLCVTHLPQVACKGHNHFRVSKLSDGENTRTRVANLSQDERVEELARMLGGQKITARTREHAAEMLGVAAKQSSAG
jgi:DNA repair protein RecN (Recombination protein N)